MNATKKQLIFNAIPTIFSFSRKSDTCKFNTSKRLPPKEREPYQPKKRKVRMILNEVSNTQILINTFNGFKFWI